MDNLICAVYEGDLPEVASESEFNELCECLTDSKSNTALADIFMLLHGKTKSAVAGVGIFDKLRDRYLYDGSLPIEKTYYGEKLMEYTKMSLIHLSETLISISKRLECGTDAEVLEIEHFKTDAERLRALTAINDYEGMRTALSEFKFSARRLGKLKKTEKIDFLRDREDAWVRKKIPELKTKFFSYGKDEWVELCRRMYAHVDTAAKFIRKFDEVLLQEKLRRGMLEHADVARFAYKALYDENGKKTDIAKAYSDRFTSVYIDEYQDVNDLQNAIFDAVSNNNRFMVGDIKQSIYGFRSANPMFFSNMKNSFPPLDKSAVGGEASIFMSENYRCDEGIICFVNTVFDKVFEAIKKSISYVKEDRLDCKKKYDKYPKPPYTPAEIYLVEKPSGTTDTADDGDEEKEETYSPAFVARKIKELIKEKRNDGNKIEYSDIAIILRSKARLQQYRDALKAEGIPCECPNIKGYFMNAEVLLTLCLLNAIDNPTRDIYLAGLMCSPLFDFTADDLVRYRGKERGTTLYHAICEYNKDCPEDTRLTSFLKALEHYRCLSEGMSTDALIYRLYNETGLLALASRNGGKDNLMLLYNYARKFEGSSFKGLYSFINYINNVAERDGALDESGNTMSDGNTVKLMSAHFSKGLEFPVVFFVEAAKKLTNLDNQQRFSFREDFGLSFYLRAPGGLALARNPIHHTVQTAGDLNYFEEEMRVLYVALTRAAERLFVVGDVKAESAEEYTDKLKLRFSSITPSGVYKMSSFLDIIMLCGTDAKITFVPCEEEKKEEKGDTPPEVAEGEAIDEQAREATDKEADEVTDGESADGESADGEEAESAAPVRDEALYKRLSLEFGFKYPDRIKTELPEKMSVSRLKPNVLDGTDEAAHTPTAKGVRRRGVMPDFITGDELEKSAKEGIATHMVLQFCDLHGLCEHGTDEELLRLCDKKFISEENLKRVHREEIELFRTSSLIEDMKKARTLYRELRFNCRLAAKYFASDEKRRRELDGTTVLVQGVIDCIIEDEAGEYHLIDYKTDRLNEEEMKSEALVRYKMNKSHAVQLTYYAMAIESMFGKRPKTVSVYSMPLGKLIPIKPIDEPKDK